MKKSTRSYLVDVNVWLALVYDLHVHHDTVRQWFETLETGGALFCRTTQLGLLRLLTNPRVMGQDVLSQRAAWQVYDRTAQDARVAFLSEPARVEPEFRRLTQSSHPATNVWSDAYLAAVAATAGLSVATLDRAFASLPGVASFCLLSQ